MSYDKLHEFTDNQNVTFLRFTSLSVAIGISLILYSVISFVAALSDPTYSNSAFLLLVISILLIVMGVLFILPTGRIRQIATTEGTDIVRLMEGLNQLAKSLKGIVIILFLVIVANVILGFYFEVQ